MFFSHFVAEKLSKSLYLVQQIGQTVKENCSHLTSVPPSVSLVFFFFLPFLLFQQQKSFKLSVFGDVDKEQTDQHRCSTTQIRYLYIHSCPHSNH